MIKISPEGNSNCRQSQGNKNAGSSHIALHKMQKRIIPDWNFSNYRHCFKILPNY